MTIKMLPRFRQPQRMRRCGRNVRKWKERQTLATHPRPHEACLIVSVIFTSFFTSLASFLELMGRLMEMIWICEEEVFLGSFFLVIISNMKMEFAWFTSTFIHFSYSTIINDSCWRFSWWKRSIWLFISSHCSQQCQLSTDVGDGNNKDLRQLIFRYFTSYIYCHYSHLLKYAVQENSFIHWAVHFVQCSWGGKARMWNWGWITQVKYVLKMLLTCANIVATTGYWSLLNLILTNYNVWS